MIIFSDFIKLWVCSLGLKKLLLEKNIVSPKQLWRFLYDVFFLYMYILLNIPLVCSSWPKFSY